MECQWVLFTFNFMFEFPCIVSQYYIRTQQDATLAVSFISHCKITCFGRLLRPSSGVLKTVVAATGAVATDLRHPYWIYIIPTHDMHQWLLLQI
jgi:hypothetical protein